MKRHQWTDAELIAVGARYKHKGDWKRSSNRLDSAAYQAALARPDVFEQATSHMTPKASPYSGSYTVYAYEFADKHVYVGLTFLPVIRRLQHAQRGPVFEHAKVCSSYSLVTLDRGISEPKLVSAVEQHWIDVYTEAGWTLLNQNKAGGLGTVQKTKWTREAILAEALKYQTKQEWIDDSQMSYRIAKREGWFDEASAHMPKRKFGIGAGRTVSQATRRKQREAKLGGTLTKAHRDKISESVRIAWVVRSKWIGEN